MPKPFEHHISQETYIAATPEKVYDTITSAKDWDTFFTTGMELVAKPGGVMNWKWKDWGPGFYNVEVPGEVVEAERPKLFIFRWGAKRQTTITIALTPKFGGTVLHLTEDGYDDTPEDRAMILECASGWGEAVTLLKFYIEHGIVYTPPVRK